MISSILYTLLAAISKDAVKLPQAELNDAQFQSLLTMVLGVAGVVAVIFVILGGYKYATSQGNPTDLENAKNRIVYALVGLGFVIFAFVIVQFVTANLF